MTALDRCAKPRPPRGEYDLERKGKKRGDFWVGRKHSPESREKMRRSAVAARASGSHDCLKKPVDRPSECLQCGGSFIRKSRNRILGKKFCSRTCQYKNKRERAQSRKLKLARQCKRCRKMFAPKWTGRNWSNFCSTACRKTRAHQLLPCAECGKLFAKLVPYVRRSRNHFCSRQCLHKFGRGANSPMFRPESILDPKRRATTSEWKRISAEVRARDGHACRRCGEAWSGSRAFPVDHVIPWRVFEDKAKANDKSNLVTLCPRCHSWKTSRAERLWFQGDMIEFEQYRTAIGISEPRRA